PRRSARVHALVRPRARDRTRAKRRGRHRRRITLSLRRRASARGVPPHGALLPTLVAPLQTLAPEVAAQGRRASRRARLALPHACRRRPRPMARAATGRRSSALPFAVGVHGARSPAAAHGGEAGALATTAAAVRRSRGAHRAGA